MGFNNTSTSISLTAKLTTLGREKLLGGSSNVITHFSIGDGDANYNASLPLNSGEVPNSSGDLGASSNTGNSVIDYVPKSLLHVNSTGVRKKLVKDGSSEIVTSTALLGQSTISGASISHNVVDKTDYSSDSLVNLFYSFGLPISVTDLALFTASTTTNGGYANTALSGLAQDNIVVMGIDSTEYGEMIDGKSIKVDLNTTASTFTLYGTYEKTLTNSKVQDANYKEKSLNSSILGNNIVLLFSDDIQKPNSNVSKSWATGHFTSKPFTLNNKEQFNMFSDTITATIADKPVGVAFLDKGFVVITEPTIVNDFDPLSSGGTATTIAFDSISTQVTQEVTCIIDRGEFATSTNKTFTNGDTTRISEVLLLDTDDNILALAKSDRHIEKTAQQFMALGIKITV